VFVESSWSNETNVQAEKRASRRGSTKEFVFHGFYTRIRRQLEQHWNPKVRTQFVEWRRKGRRIASADNLVTRCLITLDKNGNIVSVKIIGDSGMRELDQIAVDALRSAAPFPNPPGGMIDDDGSIKIRWDFILET
jgi:protein TonB